jgi:hypothetical protein
MSYLELSRFLPIDSILLERYSPQRILLSRKEEQKDPPHGRVFWGLRSIQPTQSYLSSATVDGVTAATMGLLEGKAQTQLNSYNTPSDSTCGNRPVLEILQLVVMELSGTSATMQSRRQLLSILAVGPSISEISNNVGSVKYFLSALRRSLRRVVFVVPLGSASTTTARS